MCEMPKLSVPTLSVQKYPLPPFYTVQAKNASRRMY